VYFVSTALQGCSGEETTANNYPPDGATGTV